MSAKLLIWNCRKKFRAKCEKISHLACDILVISECENPTEIEYPKGFVDKYAFKWTGKNKNSGLGVFVRKDWKISLVKRLYDDSISYVLPVTIKIGKKPLNIFAVWACPGDRHYHRYIGQVWLYLQKFLKKFPTKNVLVAGDFNSNTNWDHERRVANHTDVVNLLKVSGIESVYHVMNNESHGSETVKTFYSNKKKGYHIDYCFASKDIRKRKVIFEVEKHKQWHKKSDHLPIVMTIN